MHECKRYQCKGECWRISVWHPGWLRLTVRKTESELRITECERILIETIPLTHSCRPVIVSIKIDELGDAGERIDTPPLRILIGHPFTRSLSNPCIGYWLA